MANSNDDHDGELARFMDLARRGDVGGVRGMIRQRPDLVHMDTAGNDEHRALHHAVLNRNIEMTRMLMEAGADARKGIYPHRDATSALTIAEERGYDEIVSTIEEAERHRREAMSCPNATVSSIQEQYNAAARAGKDDEALRILESDESIIRACDRDGGTPLHVAAETLSERLVAWLLDRQANPRKTDLRGLTPLERAVLAGEWRREGSLARFPAVARLLRSRGSELTVRSAVALGEMNALIDLLADAVAENQELGHPGPLTIAVNHERPEMLRLLLDLGIHPDERHRVADLDESVSSWGEPLWRCAASGKYEMADMLLDRGADPNAQVYASGTPVFQAFGVRDERMKQLLIRRGGKPDATLVGLYRQTDMAREMLVTDDNPGRVRDAFAGETTAEQLLWGGACGGDPEIVRMSLEHITWPREDERWFKMLEQPLRIWNHGPGHWVARGANELDRSTYPVCFKLILDRCDPNIAGRFGCVMLHRVAALGSTWGQKVMTEDERRTFTRMLLDAGARLDARDDLLKSTSLGWAVRWERREMVELLLEHGAPATEPDAEPWATPLAWATKRGCVSIAELLRNSGAAR